MLLILFITSTLASFANTQQTAMFNCSLGTSLMDFSHNSITTLDNDNFSNCLSLQILKADHNKIHKIESGTFLPLKELEYVDLSHNRINHIDDYLFENNEKLRTVILSYNPLVVPDLISRSLHSFFCDFCKRIEVMENTFTTMPNVQTISLVGTNIQPFYIQQGLAALHSLQEFIIKDNRSKRCFRKHEYPTLVELQENNVTLGLDVFCKVNDCIQTKLSLMCKHLHLKSIEPIKSNIILSDYSYNSISRIMNKTFASNSSIRILRLSHNLIKNIENDAFRTLRHLQYIDLSHNKLEIIQDSLFTDNKNLLTVDISYNSVIVPQLQSNSLETLVCDFCKQIVVEENSFSAMPNLKALRVIGTEVKPFDESAAMTLPHLREFEITRNDSRRCFPKNKYPGLLYLREKGVIQGENVFCKEIDIVATPYTTGDVTKFNPPMNNHGQRNAIGSSFLLIVTYTVVFIFNQT